MDGDFSTTGLGSVAENIEATRALLSEMLKVPAILHNEQRHFPSISPGVGRRRHQLVVGKIRKVQVLFDKLESAGTTNTGRRVVFCKRIVWVNTVLDL